MDNKKIYKKISTLFWFILAILPLILALIGYIGQFLGKVFVDNNTTNDLYRTFAYFFTEHTNFITNYIPSFIKTMFIDLFTLIDNQMTNTFALCLSWFVWVYIMELFVDFMVWLPKFFHNILSKGVDKID